MTFVTDFSLLLTFTRKIHEGFFGKTHNSRNNTTVRNFPDSAEITKPALKTRYGNLLRSSEQTDSASTNKLPLLIRLS